MAPQPCVAVEGPWALCTAVERVERLDRCPPWVCPRLVEAQRALTEGAGAQGTAAGLLGGMPAAAVQQQSREVCEAAATGAARAGAAALSVCALVQVKAATVTEALAALVADVERLASVGASVCTEVGCQCVALTAVKAAVAAVAAMGTLVAQQHRTVAEALATLTAHVRPSCRGRHRL